MLMLTPEMRNGASAFTPQIHLIRHGAHDDVGRRLSGRATAGGLTIEGRAQASAVARMIGLVDIVYASPRRRTLETAAIVAEAHCVKMVEANALDEIDFGAWNGQLFSDLDRDPLWRDWNGARSTARTPGGETMAEATDRAIDFIETVSQEALAPGGSAALVTHCDIIRGVLARHLGLDLDYMLRFDIDPGSVSTILLTPGDVRVLRVNATPA